MNGQPAPSPLAISALQLRWLVGGVGERLGWWSSRFTFAALDRTFELLFPRSGSRARVESVTAAAARVHDAGLSPRSFHLFRFPAVDEARLADAWTEAPIRLPALASEPSAVLVALQTMRTELSSLTSTMESSSGAVRIGTSASIHSALTLAAAVDAYVGAAQRGQTVLPYVE
jgi:hypothetical protein